MGIVVLIILVLILIGALRLLGILKKPPPPEQPSNQITSETWKCSECESENDGLWKLCTDCGVKK